MTHDKPATRLAMAELTQDVELAPDAYQWERAKRLGVAERTMVYLDESGFAQDRPRTHGYSHRGKGC